MQDARPCEACIKAKWNPVIIALVGPDFSIFTKDLYRSTICREKRATCNCSTVDLGEIRRAYLWETYGRKVRAVPECMQCTRVHLNNALSWLAGAVGRSFQPVIQWANVGNHARAAFSL